MQHKSSPKINQIDSLTFVSSFLFLFLLLLLSVVEFEVKAKLSNYINKLSVSSSFVAHTANSRGTDMIIIDT